MDAKIVLVFGMIVLACGGISMLIARSYSPRLLGLRWLAATFGMGALSAGLLLVSSPSYVSTLFADLALLSSFLLLYCAVLQVTRETNRSFLIPAMSMGLQAFADFLQMGGYLSHRPRLTSIGICVAMQTVLTARVLWKFSRKRARAPAIFSTVLLILLAGFNLLRTAVMGLNLWSTQARLFLSLIAFELFIAVALGLAFGFFWMATSSLTEEIEHLASTDPLTRVYNRRVFLSWCERELSRTQRTGLPFSLLMVDLDHFKHVNDNFGHQRGDEVLCAVVERMQDSVRGIDVLCRWGGEEFAVLLPNARSEATLLVAERIRASVQKLEVPLEQESVGKRGLSQLTVSIGAATYRDLNDDIASILQRADNSLYRAKAEGRNQVLVAG